jgi:disulfide oxidoreductase YuzD
MEVNVPFSPKHSEEWLDHYFKKNYYKKPYDRFSWWRSYVEKNKPLSSRAPLRDKILNGDFDFGSYRFEAEVVEHKINKKFKELYNDQGKYIEETSLDRARRKRLLEDFEKDETRKLNDLAKHFSDLIGLPQEKVLDELADFDGTLIEFYFSITEKYPRKNGIAY